MKATTLTTLLTCALLASALLAAPRDARAAESDHPADLVQVLNGIDTFIDHDLLLRAGANNDGKALRDVLVDTSLPRYTRVRAANALSFFPSEVNSELLAAVALDEAEDPEVRIAAISVFGWSDMPSPGPVLIAAASPLVGNDDIRATAIRAAGRLTPERALPVLTAIRSQLAVDDAFEPVVLDHLERLRLQAPAPN